MPVSYTHLDVYKRQVQTFFGEIDAFVKANSENAELAPYIKGCLLYTSRCV